MEPIKLVVIAGAFNPVTVAHIHLGQLAKKRLPKARVVFVPAADSFLTSWKKLNDEDMFSAAERVKMLILGLEETDFYVNTCEVDGKVSGKTYDTLMYLVSKHGINKKDVYFMCGSDKLGELEQWYQIEQLLKQFRLLVVGRAYENTKETVCENSFLHPYQTHIIILENDEQFQEISSTKVRQSLRIGDFEKVRQMIPETVYEYLVEKGVE